MEPIHARLSEFALLGDALAVLGEASPTRHGRHRRARRAHEHPPAGGGAARARRRRCPIEASTVVRTDATFLAAVPDMTVTEKQAQATLIRSSRKAPSRSSPASSARRPRA
jgi:hypothetical protein